jgi:hypothetical protein
VVRDVVADEEAVAVVTDRLVTTATATLALGMH